MGHASGVATDMQMKNICEDVSQRETFRSNIFSEEARLLELLENGEITPNQYKDEIDKLFSSETVLSYLENSGNPEDESRAINYRNGRNAEKVYLGICAPIMTGATLDGITATTIASFIERKYRRKLEKLAEQEDVATLER